VIDVIAQDSNTGEAVLVMNEPEPWDDSDERLLAYRSDLTLTFRFCSMAKWRRRILNSPTGQPGSSCVAAHMPDTRALELLGMIHDQLAFQEIKMEVVVAETRV